MSDTTESTDVQYLFGTTFEITVNAATSLGFQVSVKVPVSVWHDEKDESGDPELPVIAQATKDLVRSFAQAGFVGVSAASAPQAKNTVPDAAKSDARPGVNPNSWEKDQEYATGQMYTDPLLQLKVVRSQNDDDLIQYALFTRRRNGSVSEFPICKATGDKDIEMLNSAIGTDVTGLKVGTIIKFKEGSTVTWQVGKPSPHKAGAFFHNLRGVVVTDTVV